MTAANWSPLTEEQKLMIVKHRSNVKTLLDPWSSEEGVYLDLRGVTPDNLEDCVVNMQVPNRNGDIIETLAIMPSLMSNMEPFTLHSMVRTKVGDGKMGEFSIMDLLGKRWRVIRGWQVVQGDLNRRLPVYTLFEE